MVTEREHFGHSHRLGGHRLEQSLGRALDRQLDGVAVDERLALEQPGEGLHASDIDRAVFQLGKGDGAAVDQTRPDRQVAVAFCIVDTAIDRIQVDARVDADHRFAGEALGANESDEPPDGVVAAVGNELAAQHPAFPPG